MVVLSFGTRTLAQCALLDNEAAVEMNVRMWSKTEFTKVLDLQLAERALKKEYPWMEGARFEFFDCRGLKEPPNAAGATPLF